MKSLQIVDELAELASRAEPPPLDDVTARRLVDRAMRQPRAITHAPVSIWRYIAPAIAAIAIACIVLAWPRGSEVTPEATIQLTLPTGDRLSGTAGARFEIAEVVPAARRIKLHGGTMLFDVAKLVDGQRFEVAIGSTTVIATGTIFSVGVEPAGTRVRVYEGRVEVHHGERIDRLGAGETWGSGVASADPASISEAAQLALITRATTPSVPAPVPVPATTIARPSAPTTAPTAPTKAIVIGAPTAVVPAAKSDTKTQPTKIIAKPDAAIATRPNEGVAKPDDPLALAHADLAAGRYQAAIDRAAGRDDSAWLLVLADAHRGLRHALLAAEAYDRAAKRLSGVERATAGYNAAYLRFRELRDPASALTSLQAAGVDADDSPIEERGLALAAQLLVALQREADARPLAERYLKRFPRGDLVVLMRKLANR